MINSVTLGDVKFKLEFLLPLFSTLFALPHSSSWWLETLSAGCNEECCVQISRAEGLNLVGLFFRDEVKKLRQIKTWRMTITRM